MEEAPISNVIPFPKANPKFVPPDLNVEQQILNLKLDLIQKTIEEITPMLFHRLGVAGFPHNPAYMMKDGALLVESIRSLMCKIKGIDHPLQTLAENFFRQENNQLTTASNVKLSINVTNNHTSEA